MKITIGRAAMTGHVRVTRDTAKLWSCKLLRKKHPELVRRQPATTGAGKVLTVEVPAKTRREMRGIPICQASRFWIVPQGVSDLTTADPKQVGVSTWVCEHQVDEILAVVKK